MPRAKKMSDPRWWHDLPDEEYKAAAYAYMKASYDAHVAVTKVIKRASLSGDKEAMDKLLMHFAEHLEPQLKDGPSLSDLDSPPPLHATMYATRSYGPEKMRAAITGLGWAEVFVEALREAGAPVAPMLGAAENLPDGADIEMFTLALTQAFADSLEMPKTHSNTPIVVAIVDIWVKKLTGKNLSDHHEFQASEMELFRTTHSQHIWALSMMPTQTIDRAARSARGWSFPTNDVPTFEDVNNKHIVSYFADGLTQEALREGVMQLNPHTADVWRLVTATILESWNEGEREPPRVWLDARQLCDTMGFKKHHKGGHRPENVAVAARALVDLERFYITIPYGTKQYPADANGNRKATTVQARAQHRVLAVMGKEEARQLFDTEWLPMRWLVTAGEWIKAYPREQFAPLFRTLVELPITYKPDQWAKAIGTELVWQYRQDQGKVQTQRVETMLRQAYVLEEAREERNKKRVRDSFEKAMDTLEEKGVCASWSYNGTDIDLVELKSNSKGWFDLWLQTRIVVTPPPEVTKVLKNITRKKKKYRRKAQEV